MTTLIGRGWLNATCINHQQPPRARIFHGIQDLILTTNHFIIMSVIWIADNARNTCGFASFFILDQDGPAGQLRPPFKYIYIAKNCSDVHYCNPLIWSHHLQALFIPKIYLQLSFSYLHTFSNSSSFLRRDTPLRSKSLCSRRLWQEDQGIQCGGRWLRMWTPKSTSSVPSAMPNLAPSSNSKGKPAENSGSCDLSLFEYRYNL